MLHELEQVLRDRRVNPVEASYSTGLVHDGERARRKIMEEAFELTLELGRTPVDQRRAAEEAADVLFHVLAGLVGADVPLDAVLDELAARRVPPEGRT